MSGGRRLCTSELCRRTPNVGCEGECEQWQKSNVNATTTATIVVRIEGEEVGKLVTMIVHRTKPACYESGSCARARTGRWWCDKRSARNEKQLLSMVCACERELKSHSLCLIINKQWVKVSHHLVRRSVSVCNGHCLGLKKNDDDLLEEKVLIGKKGMMSTLIRSDSTFVCYKLSLIFTHKWWFCVCWSAHSHPAKLTWIVWWWQSDCFDCAALFRLTCAAWSSSSLWGHQCHCTLYHYSTSGPFWPLLYATS